MARSIIIFLLFAATVRADYYSWTNSADEHQHSTFRGDANGAIGAVATSAVPPVVDVIIEPEIRPNGIEVPFFILTNDTTGVGFEFRVNQHGQLIGGVTNHASPRRSKAAIDADFDALDVENTNRLTRIERIAVDLQQVDATISNINVNAATWANANQRATMVAIKGAVRNLMQATDKVRKELEK